MTVFPVSSTASDRLGFVPLLRVVRPRQWVKNALVFVAPAAGGVLFEVSLWPRLLLVFAAFCLVSSAAYAENDAVDAPLDRLDPRKASRPVAAGVLSVRSARMFAVALLFLGVALGFLVGLPVVLVLVIYVANSSLYSRVVKRVPYVEMVAVSFGFVLRLLAGVVASGVVFAWSLVAMTAMLSFSVLLVKRSSEIVEGVSRRRVLGRYRPKVLRVLLVVSCVGGVCSAAVFGFGASQPLVGVAAALGLACVVLRLVAASSSGRGAEPDRLLFRDPLLLAGLAVWFLALLLPSLR
jgi:decaprenyl-phosphate phosphoribosyltransferase